MRRTSVPFVRRLSLLAALLLALVAAPGCEDEASPADTDAVDDTSTPGDTSEPDAGPPAELEPLPEFEVAVTATPSSGNAPLVVDFEVSVEGDGGYALEELECDWTVDGNAVGQGATFSNTWFVPATAEVEACCLYLAPDGRSTTACGDTLVRVEKCADLEFGTVTLSGPLDVAQGDPVTLQGGLLFNQNGGEITQDFDVLAVLSTDDIVDLEADTILWTYTVEGMADGQSVTSSIDIAAAFNAAEVTVPADLANGNYFVFFVADPVDPATGAGVVNECQETNNVKATTSNLTVDESIALKPDLVVTNVAPIVPGLVLNQGDSLNFKFTIANEGEGEASQFRRAVWISTDQTLDEDEDLLVFAPTALGATTQQMAVGQSQNYNNGFKITPEMADGTYYIIVAVDVNEQVVEEDEANNVAVSEETFEVFYEAPACADIEVLDILVVPSATYWGGSVKATVTLFNGGTQPTPEGLAIKAYMPLTAALNPSAVDPSNIFDFELPALEPLETIQFDMVWTIASGTPVIEHYVGVIADPDSNFSECSEGNNSALWPTPLTIDSEATVDIVMGTVEFHPPAVVAGQDIKVTFTLDNVGTSAATAFRTAIVLSTDANISDSQVSNGQDLLVGELIVDVLEPTSTETYVHKVTIPEVLDHTVTSYYVGVVADWPNDVTKDKQSNNDGVASTQLTVIEPQGGCFEDEWEDNDLTSVATEVAEGTYEGLGSCGNPDWYKVPVPQGHSLIVDVVSEPIQSFVETPSNIDVELYANATQLVDESRNGSAYEQVTAFAVSAAGVYYIKVDPTAANVRAAYDLHIDVVEPVEGVDLVATDVQALPAFLYPGGVLAAEYTLINLGDQPAPAHQSTFYVSQSPDLDDTAIEVATVEVGLVQPASIDTSVTAEFVLPEDLLGGFWYVHAVADSGESIVEVDEVNNVSASDVVILDSQLSCTDDDLEPNNAWQLAHPMPFNNLGTSVSTGLVVCPQLDDWYSVELIEGQAFTASVTYPWETERGLLSVEIWDPTGKTAYLADDSKNTADVQIPWVWASGTYFVRVGNKPDKGNSAPYTYTLTLAQTPPDPEMACDADVFEPGDSFDAAKPLGCGLQSGTLCVGDVDYYRIDLQPYESLTIDLQHEENDLAMAIHTGVDQPPAATKTSNGELSWAAEALPETIWLRVYSDVKPTSLDYFPYTLFLDGISGVDLKVNEPALLYPWVYNGNDNLMSFQLENTCVNDSGAFTTTIWLSEDDELDGTDVWLKDIAIEDVAGQTLVDISEKVTIPFSTTPGDYYLLAEADSGALVDESNEANNAAGLEMAVDKICLPDVYEPNDFLFGAGEYLAPQAETGLTSGLALCPGDVDFYAIPVEAGQTLTANILFSHEEGDLDLRLYDAAYTDPLGNITVPVANSQSITDNETISWPSAQPTTFYLWVGASNSAISASYALELLVQ